MVRRKEIGDAVQHKQIKFESGTLGDLDDIRLALPTAAPEVKRCVLQRVAVCCSVLRWHSPRSSDCHTRIEEVCVAVCCAVLQCVAVCHSVSQCVAVTFASLFRLPRPM